MTSAFSSVDSAAIERTVDSDGTEPLQLTDIWTEDRLSECSAWIRDHGFRAVCLQFPDELLPFSAHIAHELKSECRRQTTAISDEAAVEVYILGDTSYGSCCVDEVRVYFFGILRDHTLMGFGCRLLLHTSMPTQSSTLATRA